MMNIMLLAANLEGAAAFYKRLGINLMQEQHGRSPIHFSTSGIVEIYPELKSIPAEDKVCILIEVDEPEVMKQELISDFSGVEASPPIRTTATGIASLRDPNGFLVRLLPKSSY